ncbi:sigma 54-interacting transcriptional regulator [Glaciecola petra]|uniref:Sigma 54-interacting transcriptional regulator n=1 Tax=Glaciecola petra TaxID=3075602 RepID=A0ABU2ZTG8_9ALTE|nr:sigma 54-interacting transcriptional regulator [Aestuariibacter sp. P117]MDT0595614.1 sigma 54-interacting transcriptional regulator [Aestuariibacter sp. P117]
MKHSHYKSDTILSVLLQVTQCDFVRVTETNVNGDKRSEFGIYEDKFQKFTHALDQFVAEKTYIFNNYEFSFCIFNSHHLHIDCCAHEFDKITDADGEEANSTTNKVLQNRKSHYSESQISKHFSIDLMNKTGLPATLFKLANPESDNTDINNAEGTQLLLSTLCATIESLQLINQYEKYTRDSLTNLQSRSSLQGEIDEQISHSGIALCLVHCNDFQQVNRKFGQEQGDLVLHEIAAILEKHTRAEDISGRFGGALFGVATKASEISDGMHIASKLQNALHSKPYLKNSVRLTFNVGISFVSQQEAALDNNVSSSILINRAEQALKAAQNAEKPSIVQWEPDKFRLDEQEFNYLGGIFTPDNVTNYRNMLLLWDISSIIADEHSFPPLLKSVIERLAYTFEFTYAGIICSKGEQISDHGFKLDQNTEISNLDWNECEYREPLREAAENAIKNSQHTEHEENQFKSLIIPLGTEADECFFIMGESDRLDLTHDSIMLFVGFARQIGKALKRSQLEDELNKKLERQNAKLAKELTELKAGIKSSALVYRSLQMRKIVELTQRAAQTDTTVLVTGESGTGKEKLMHAIHRLGDRSERPLIIVDCGSIPETLIESELFGHTKGAFTGAQSDSKGKIQAANGGILVLDEIGELPLSMQPKLLRFVQEKNYTPVGSNTPIDVDVKIVAVTNRDLAKEVSLGNFRKDLYYRLNVVALHNPPLRERKEDIDLLSKHFLSKFSQQFDIGNKFLSPQTIGLMQTYSWPGNVRELENALMQASLLTIQDEITFNDLNLDIDNNAVNNETHMTQANSNEVLPINGQASDIHINHLNGQAPDIHINAHDLAELRSDVNIHTQENTESEHFITVNPTWERQYKQKLDALVAALNPGHALEIAIGNAVENALLHEAFAMCKSANKTALLLQIPVSTARRRLMKPRINIGAIEHSSQWQNVLALLKQIVRGDFYVKEPMEVIRLITASRILSAYSSNMTLASQLMGVSEPTMYKLRKNLSYLGL